MLVLLPPSREKSERATRVPWHRGALGSGPLADARREVVSAAQQAVAACRGDDRALGRLLDASGGALEAAAEALAAVDERPTAGFLDRYTGILYRTLRGETWTDAHAERGRRQLGVMSALWGVVTGRDAIPDARLNIAASLPALDAGLATWWRARTGAVLDDVARERVVVDLRSSGYDRAWSPPPDARAVVSVRFLRTDGDRAEPSALGKQRKGALARLLIDADLHDHATAGDVAGAAADLAAGTRLVPDASDLSGRHPTLVYRAV